MGLPPSQLVSAPPNWCRGRKSLGTRAPLAWCRLPALLFWRFGGTAGLQGSQCGTGVPRTPIVHGTAAGARCPDAHSWALQARKRAVIDGHAPPCAMPRAGVGSGAGTGRGRTARVAAPHRAAPSRGRIGSFVYWKFLDSQSCPSFFNFY